MRQGQCGEVSAAKTVQHSCGPLWPTNPWPPPAIRCPRLVLPSVPMLVAASIALLSVLQAGSPLAGDHVLTDLRSRRRGQSTNMSAHS